MGRHPGRPDMIREAEAGSAPPKSGSGLGEGSGAVACPPHVTPDRYRVDEQNRRHVKGVVDAALVPEGETTGAVLRADIETGLEGIEVISLTSAKPARSPDRVEG